MAAQFDMAAQLTQPAESSAAARLASLDAFRGFIMFWIVGGTAIIRAIVDLGRNPVSDFLAWQSLHSRHTGHDLKARQLCEDIFRCRSM